MLPLYATSSHGTLTEACHSCTHLNWLLHDRDTLSPRCLPPCVVFMSCLSLFVHAPCHLCLSERSRTHIHLPESLTRLIRTRSTDAGRLGEHFRNTRIQFLWTVVHALAHAGLHRFFFFAVISHACFICCNITRVARERTCKFTVSPHD